MLEIVLESPWVVGAIGALLTVVAAYLGLRSGRPGGLWAAAAALVLTLLLVAIGVWVETEQESLRAMIHRTASDLQNNRRAEVIAAIYDNPTDEVLEARRLLEQKIYRFDFAAVKKIHEIKISGLKSERRAQVKMNVFVEGQFGSYKLKVPRFVELTLYRVGDRWLVYDFKHDQPFAGFQGN